VVVVASVLLGLQPLFSLAPAVQASSPPPGTITTYAGSLGVGVATSVPQAPSALALDASANVLYIGDGQAAVVRALDLSSGQETIYAGTGSQASTGDGGPATSAAVGIPGGIALDSAGNLFIATVDRIRRVDHTTHVISTVAGGGNGALGDGGPATLASLLTGWVAVDGASGDLYISDSGHNRIRRVHQGVITTVVGTGAQGWNGDHAATSTELNSPEGIWVGQAGTIWFADSGNDIVRTFTPGGTVTTIAGTPGQNYPPCQPGTSLVANLQFPYGVWQDSSGAVYVASTGGCVEKIAGATMQNIAGCGSAAPPCPTTDGPALSTELSPSDAVGDASGNLFIAEGGGGRVRKLVSGNLTTIAGTGGQCEHNNGIPAAEAYFCDPVGIASDSAGNIFIADRNANVVEEVAVDGTVSTVAGSWTHGYSGDGLSATQAQLWGPTSVAVDGSGNLFIADWINSAIREVSGGVITTYATLSDPRAITIDSEGDIYVVQPDNNRVSKIAAAPPHLITTVAGTGVGGYSGDGGPAASAEIHSPYGVGIDPAGNIYIDDALNERIRKVDPNGIISTYAQAANVPQISYPGGQLAVGPGGQIVVAGAFNPSVLLIGPGGIVRTLAGSTTAGFAGDGGPAGAALLNWPAGVAFNAAGDLYVSDSYNHRIRRIETYGATSAPTNASASAGFDSVRAQWTPPVNNTTLPVLSYTVTPYLGGTPQAPLAVSGVPAPASIVIPGLVAGSEYTFTVTASNGWMTSPPSATTAPVTVLAHPARGAIITWTGLPGAGPALNVAQAPYSVALSGTHVFVADPANYVVRDINTVTSQETVAAGNGGFGYRGNGGPALNGMISAATAVVSCGGSLYFDDTFNYVIRKVDPNGVITVVVGTGIPGYSGDGGPATSARISEVFGMACRPLGGLYIADSSNGAVRILYPNGTIATWQKGFSFPTGIVALDPTVDDVAISDAGSDNVVGELIGSNAYLLAGTPGIAGFADGQVYDPNTGVLGTLLNDPRGLAFNPGSSGQLFVADRGNNRIRLIQLGYVSTALGSGVAGFNGDNQSYSTIELNEPTDLSMSGNLIVFADTGNFRVRVLNLAGGPSVQTIAGNGFPSDSGDSGPSMQAQVGDPYAVAVDSAGNQYVADAQDNVIRKIGTDGVITTFAGTGVAGFAGEGVPALAAELNDPRGVAVGPNGDVYISDTGNQRVRKVDHTSGAISTVVASGLNYARAVAVGADGNLYIADTGDNRVLKVDGGGTVTIFAGTGIPGFSGDGGPATAAMLDGPRGLAIDAAGDVYISDSSNNRVRRVHLGSITTAAGDGSAGVIGDGGLATNAELNFPFGLAFDGAGNLYIADTGNSRIRLVDGSTDRISTVVGVCGSGLGGDWGPAALGYINFPFGLGVDANGTIYIADSANNRVRIVYGLAGVRGVPCQAPPGSPGSRSANHSPAIPAGTRVEQSVSNPSTRTAVARVVGDRPASPQTAAVRWTKKDAASQHHLASNQSQSTMLAHGYANSSGEAPHAPPFGKRGTQPTSRVAAHSPASVVWAYLLGVIGAVLVAGGVLGMLALFRRVQRRRQLVK
jgi:sugar lactone lactonase YvrE